MWHVNAKLHRIEATFKMSTKKAAKPIMRAWVRGSPGWPIADQIEAVTTQGKVAEKMVYGIAKEETIGDCINGMQAGDVLVVMATHRLGKTMAEYSGALEQLRRKRVVIRDLLRKTDIAGARLEVAAIIADDRRELVGEARIDAAGLRKRQPGRASIEEAERIWHDMSYATDPEAAKAAKWGKRTLFKKFGSSGRKQGRKAQK